MKFERAITHNNYIMRDHKVHGVRILPGVTFLDMIYRFGIEMLGHAQFELKNVLFKEPLTTDVTFNQQVQVYYSFNNPDWHVNVMSRRTMGDHILEEKWHEIMQCTLRIADAGNNEEFIFIPREFIAHADRQSDMAEIYRKLKYLDIVHGDFMQTLGRVYQRNRQELLVLNLSGLAEEYRTKFYIHPAFLDGATLAGSSFRLSGIDRADEPAKNPFIPFSIKKFRAFDRLPLTIYVHSGHTGDDEGQKSAGDLISTDIRAYDEEGKLLFEFEQLTVKQIRNFHLIQKLVHTNTSQLPSEDGSSKAERPSIPPTHVSGVKETGVMRAIKTFLKEQVGKQIHQNPEDLQTNLSFYEFGMDSSHLLNVTRNLEEFCQQEFYPTLLFEYKSIDDLAQYLHDNAQTHFQNLLEDSETDEDFEENTVAAPAAVTIALAATPIPDKRVKMNEPAGSEMIAVIGLDGKYPGARNMKEFWQVIREGKNCISEVPRENWQIGDNHSSDARFDPARPKSRSKWGGFIPEATYFDPLFFNISPREAEALDPQLRILLEVCWHTLEDAGYTPESLSGSRAGVYVGVMNNDYSWVSAEHYYKYGHYASPGSYVHELANRVSHCLNFRGPSVTLANACASSLSAIHSARTSLLRGECDIALAGGVNLSLHPSKYWMLSQLGIISPESEERTFDREAKGYVPGEGVGLVFLKPLSKALKDHDHIYGVIRGSAASHSGKSSNKYMPDLHSLTEGIRAGLQDSGIDAVDVDYIECHGTGTPIGDSLEVQALSKAFQKQASVRPHCALGSKANIGHLESASGICSLTKVLMSMAYGDIPVCPNVQEINPGIKFEETPFYIPRKTQTWNKKPEARIAGVHSFGVGGSQVFLTVQGFEAAKENAEIARPEIIVLSAKTEASLLTYIHELILYLKENRESGARLSDIAYTLQVGREAMPYRLAVVAKDKSQLYRKLEQVEPGKEAKGIYQHHVTASNTNEFKVIFEELEEKTFLQTLVNKKKWGKLAYLWSRGLLIRWETLHQNRDVYRISLPTYPFARERYWIPEHNGKADSAGVGTSPCIRCCIKTLPTSLGSASARRLPGKNLSCRIMW